MAYETLLYHVANQAAWITLNRPQALNATNDQMFTELLKICEEIRVNSEIKALVITGSGEKAFCIGSDINFLEEAFRTRNFSLFRNYLIRINNVLFALEELPVPTIAMVQGKARAGGFELLMACDFVLIAEEAQIGDVHTPYGHMPGAGATQRTARKIGIQKAMELILTGKWLKGKEAVEYGIALNAVPRNLLRETTEAFLRQLTDKTRDSLSLIKAAIIKGWDLPLRDGVNLEIHSYLEYLATSVEPAELFFANQEKRKQEKKISQ